MHNEILKIQLSALPLSDEFKEKSKILGLETIEDVRKVAPKELVLMEGFDYNWLGELIDYLASKGEIGLIQSIN